MLASAMTGLLAELLVDPAERRLQRPVVEPVHQAQREEVLAASISLVVKPEAFEAR